MIMPGEYEDFVNISEKTNIFFGPDTPLKKSSLYGGREYEERPQQKEMANHIADAFFNSNNLCIEAPTGIGKSFAYMIPAVYYSIKQNKPVIVTTETISLQEQLIDKDIPLLQKLMDVEFSAALAKGRANYICLRRFKMVTGEHQAEFLPHSNQYSQIKKIQDWLLVTDNGSLSDINFDVDSTLWQSICSEHGNCFGPKCQYYKECYYWKDRKKWEKADILVANHALFLADLKMRIEGDLENGVLPQYSALILDESHQLEKNAATHLGTSIKMGNIVYFLNRLFNPDKGKGLLIRPGEDAGNLRSITQNTYSYVNNFFSKVETKIKEDREKQKRLHTPYFVEDNLTPQLEQLQDDLFNYINNQEDKNYKLELEVQHARCEFYKNSIWNFLSMNSAESVYWIEKNANSSKENISLNYSPLNISEILNTYLFSTDQPVILTSATLSVGNKLDYYKKRTGFEGKEIILGTPFDYNKQAAVYITKNTPDLYNENYYSVLSNNIINYVSKTNGKAFVLFTSYNSLLKVKDITEDYLKQKGINLLVQGQGISRARMLELFKNDLNSVIYGTTSFWMGIDVPGEALSNVIITKLPFAVPNEPIVEARMEKIKKEGGNPFMEYALPEAVLKFKQGIGRLIRSSSDKGIIVILDNRVIKKKYGKIFLDSLPGCEVNIE